MSLDPVEVYKKVNLFEKENGMNLTIDVPGKSHYKMVVLEKHLSSPGNCHGGAIAALMDATIGAAALSLSLQNRELVATVEFKINYYSPVFFGDMLEGVGEIDFEGKSLIGSTGEIRNVTQGNKLVAKAIGTFNKYPLEKKAYSGLFD